MKYILILLLGSAFFMACSSAETGKFAGSMKSLPGTSYVDSIEVPGLEGWTYRGGSMISDLDDPLTMISDVYSKDSTQIAFFSILEDSATGKYRILDLIEVPGVGTDWMLKTAFCGPDKKEDPMIVAFVKWNPELEFLEAEKAWRFDRDKNVFESIPVKGITCLNEVD